MAGLRYGVKIFRAVPKTQLYKPYSKPTSYYMKNNKCYKIKTVDYAFNSTIKAVKNVGLSPGEYGIDKTLQNVFQTIIILVREVQRIVQHFTEQNLKELTMFRPVQAGTYRTFRSLSTSSMYVKSFNVQNKSGHILKRRYSSISKFTDVNIERLNQGRQERKCENENELYDKEFFSTLSPVAKILEARHNFNRIKKKKLIDKCSMSLNSGQQSKRVTSDKFLNEKTKKACDLLALQHTNKLISGLKDLKKEDKIDQPKKIDEPKKIDQPKKNEVKQVISQQQVLLEKYNPLPKEIMNTFINAYLIKLHDQIKKREKKHYFDTLNKSKVFLETNGELIEAVSDKTSKNVKIPIQEPKKTQPCVIDGLEVNKQSKPNYESRDINNNIFPINAIVINQNSNLQTFNKLIPPQTKENLNLDSIKQHNSSIPCTTGHDSKEEQGDSTKALCRITDPAFNISDIMKVFNKSKSEDNLQKSVTKDLVGTFTKIYKVFTKLKENINEKNNTIATSSGVIKKSISSIFQSPESTKGFFQDTSNTLKLLKDVPRPSQESIEKVLKIPGQVKNVFLKRTSSEPVTSLEKNELKANHLDPVIQMNENLSSTIYLEKEKEVQDSGMNFRVIVQNFKALKSDEKLQIQATKSEGNTEESMKIFNTDTKHVKDTKDFVASKLQAIKGIRLGTKNLDFRSNLTYNKENKDKIKINWEQSKQRNQTSKLTKTTVETSNKDISSLNELRKMSFVKEKVKVFESLSKQNLTKEKPEVQKIGNDSKKDVKEEINSKHGKDSMEKFILEKEFRKERQFFKAVNDSKEKGMLMKEFKKDRAYNTYMIMKSANKNESKSLLLFKNNERNDVHLRKQEKDIALMKARYIPPEEWKESRTSSKATFSKLRHNSTPPKIRNEYPSSGLYNIKTTKSQHEGFREEKPNPTNAEVNTAKKLQHLKSIMYGNDRSVKTGTTTSNNPLNVYNGSSIPRQEYFNTKDFSKSKNYSGNKAESYKTYSNKTFLKEKPNTLQSSKYFHSEAMEIPKMILENEQVSFKMKLYGSSGRKCETGAKLLGKKAFNKENIFRRYSPDTSLFTKVILPAAGSLIRKSSLANISKSLTNLGTTNSALKKTSSLPNILHDFMKYGTNELKKYISHTSIGKTDNSDMKKEMQEKLFHEVLSKDSNILINFLMKDRKYSNMRIETTYQIFRKQSLMNFFENK